MVKVIIICSFILAGVLTPILVKKNDTVIEQVAERGLEKVLDLPEDSIDFTPEDD